MELTYEDPTIAAYEQLAPYYDRYTHDFGHEPWLAYVEEVSLRHGLQGNRLLDVGCGTGKSFVPMLERGYDVTACDISPSMAEQARERAGGRAGVFVADARELPLLGRFDLVTCIGDALNYILSEEELGMAFEGVARNLRPGGIFAFDLNTLACFRTHFLSDNAVEVDGAFFRWCGEMDEEDVVPGAVFTAVIEVFSGAGDDQALRCSSRHVQRHHPPDVVERLLRDAGLELVERRGQRAGAETDPGGDESFHMKFDYFARKHPGPPTTGEEVRT